MDINKALTLDELNIAMDILKPTKVVYLNQSTYKQVVELLGYKPINLIVNEFIPSNQAIMIDIEETENCKKNLFTPKFNY